MDDTLDTLQLIKDNLEQNKITTSTAKSQLLDAIRDGIVFEAIYDLEKLDCTTSYLRDNGQGYQHLTNLFRDFLDEHHESYFGIARARFIELYKTIKIELKHYAEHEYDFNNQAIEELECTEDVEISLANIKHELQELLHICDDFSDIDQRMEQDIAVMYNNIKLIQDRFCANHNTRLKHHKECIIAIFHDKLDICLDYLDLAMFIIDAIYDKEKTSEIVVEFGFSGADQKMVEFMTNIKQMVEDFNNSRKA
ncbi:hypothetical protein UFOVP755_42 [uncultured Caudovirales phage]|uniref:Uncharacterized protein n=1 Tax=uncultured Caudovirales phage TaxID=2100421 RepID=A0A6J7X8P0_9CAUD|nr:hypothetical protein UFOVP755_42 [uncultured Caudovirales phage]